MHLLHLRRRRFHQRGYSDKTVLFQSSAITLERLCHPACQPRTLQAVRVVRERAFITVRLFNYFSSTSVVTNNPPKEYPLSTRGEWRPAYTPLPELLGAVWAVEILHTREFVVIGSPRKLDGTCGSGMNITLISRNGVFRSRIWNRFDATRCIRSILRIRANCDQ